MLVPGDRRADEAKVATASGVTAVRIASADEVMAATGFEPGAVAPFPQRAIWQAFIDRTAAPTQEGLDRRWLVNAHGCARPRRSSAARAREAGRFDGAALKFTNEIRRGGPVQATEKIWMNGELVDWDDARIHVGAHGLHYGTGVFEGVRCYDTPKGPAVFRGSDHMQRLINSARLIYMQLPVFGRGADRRLQRPARRERAERVLHPAVRLLRLRRARRLLAGNPVEVAIMSWPWGTYLGAEAQLSGIRTKISSWQRIPANVVPHASKATGVYLNSMLAVTEAQNAGYDEAILLDAATATSPTARARRSSSSRTACSSRLTCRPGSCTGSRATR